MGFREHFRDKKEWLDSTNNCIHLNTSSDEAAKSYDASLTQLCGWYDDPSIGGLGGSIQRMVQADPEFVLGRAFELELNLMGAMAAPHLDSSLATRLSSFNELVKRRQATGNIRQLEIMHWQVVNLWARSKLKEAAQVLEQIVALYPEDVSALKMNQDTCFMIGRAGESRLAVAGSLGLMKQENPLKGYVHGMFAFGLEESNMYPQAQEQALKALELIPRDTWAIHNYAHCLEMQAKTDEGLKWMEERRVDWQPCNMLACHQYWHTSLFLINSNREDEARAYLDEEILTRCVANCTSLDLHDAASMVYRMELANLLPAVSDAEGAHARRWKCINELAKSHSRDHLLGFNDAHFMMAYLGSDEPELARELIESAHEATQLNEGTTVVKPLLEAMQAFKAGEAARCVDLLAPLRLEIIKIGGSHAQRDIFEQLLLVAALRSDRESHNRLGERMIRERDTFQGRRTNQTELLVKSGKI